MRFKCTRLWGGKLHSLFISKGDKSNFSRPKKGIYANAEQKQCNCIAKDVLVLTGLILCLNISELQNMYTILYTINGVFVL